MCGSSYPPLHTVFICAVFFRLPEKLSNKVGSASLFSSAQDVAFMRSACAQATVTKEKKLKLHYGPFI